MNGTAEGRGLAMGRLGRLALAAAIFADAAGCAEACAPFEAVVFRALVGKASVPGTVSSDLGGLSMPGVAGMPGNARAAAEASIGFGTLRASPLVGRAAVPAAVSGALGAVAVQRHLLGGHKVGGSMGGAVFRTVIRASPVHNTQEYDSNGPTNSDVVSAVPVLWLSMLATNSGSETLYLMQFDATTVPLDGAAPMRQPIQLFPGGQTYLDIGDPGADGLSGLATKNGLCWAASTTPTTLTQDTTSSVWVTARFIVLGS